MKTVIGNIVVDMPDNVDQANRAYGAVTNTPVSGGQLADGVSSRFELIDVETRETVGILTEQADGLGRDGWGLQMIHLGDDHLPYSNLRWTRPFSAPPSYAEYVILEGPTDAGNVGVPSHLVLVATEASGTNERYARMSSGDYSGTAAATFELHMQPDSAIDSYASLIVPSSAGGVGHSTVTADKAIFNTASGFYVVGGEFYMDNQKRMYGKNSTGTYEAWAHPRWSDNRLYLDGGAGGMNLRTNNAAVTNLTLETSGHARFNNQISWQADTDSGLVYISDGNWGLYSQGVAVAVVRPTEFDMGKVIVMNQLQIRLASAADGNHILQYSAATPSGSGIGSNGPILQGYTSVWLHTALTDKNLFLTEPSGSVFINAGGAAYTTFSARRLKKNIRDYAPEDALAMVMSWRPRTFKWKKEANPFRLEEVGFIADELNEVCDGLVEEQPHPDTGEVEPTTVNYAGTTPYLTGAIQALAARLDAALDRIAELEAKLTVLSAA